MSGRQGKNFFEFGSAVFDLQAKIGFLRYFRAKNILVLITSSILTPQSFLAYQIDVEFSHKSNGLLEIALTEKLNKLRSKTQQKLTNFDLDS